MDTIATVLAGIIVLAIPFLLLFRSKAQGRYERDLAEIQTLVTERSQYVDELHTRLDALEHEDSQRNSATNDESSVSTNDELASTKFRTLLDASQTVAWLDIAAKRYFDAPATLGLASSIVETRGLYYRTRLAHRYRPEWVEEVNSRELSITIEEAHRKGARKREGIRSSRDPVFQPS